MSDNNNDAILMEFMDNTGCEDIDQALSLLQLCQWDVRSASNFFFEGVVLPPLEQQKSTPILSKNQGVPAPPISGQLSSSHSSPSHSSFSSSETPQGSPLRSMVEEELQQLGVTGVDVIAEELLKRCSSKEAAINMYFQNTSFYDGILSSRKSTPKSETSLNHNSRDVDIGMDDEDLARLLQEFQDDSPVFGAGKGANSVNAVDIGLVPAPIPALSSVKKSSETPLPPAPPRYPLPATKFNKGESLFYQKDRRDPAISATIVDVHIDDYTIKFADGKEKQTESRHLSKPSNDSNSNSNPNAHKISPVRCHFDSAVCNYRSKKNELKVAEIDSDIYFYCEDCMKQYLISQRRPRDTFFADLPTPLPSHEAYVGLKTTTLSILQKPKLILSSGGIPEIDLIPDIPCPFRTNCNLVKGKKVNIDPHFIYESAVYMEDYSSINAELDQYNRIKPTIKCHFSEIMICQFPDYRFANDVMSLGCNHFFHIDCLGNYLKVEIEKRQGTIDVPFCPECVRTNSKCRCPTCCPLPNYPYKAEELEGHKFTPFELSKCFGCFSTNPLNNNASAATATTANSNKSGSKSNPLIESLIEKYATIVRDRSIKFMCEPGSQWFMCSCKRDGKFLPNNATYFDCSACKVKKCLKCSSDFHDSTISCKEAERQKRIRDMAGSGFGVLRECPNINCNHIYGIPIACKHSTCEDENCKIEFCYNCGTEYNSSIAHDNSYHYPGCQYYNDCCEGQCSRIEVDAFLGRGGKSYSTHIGLSSNETKARKSCDKNAFKPGPCTNCFEKPGLHNTCTHNGYKCWSKASCSQKHGEAGYFCRHYCFQCHFLGRLCQPLKQPATCKIIPESDIVNEQKSDGGAKVGGKLGGSAGGGGA